MATNQHKTRTPSPSTAATETTVEEYEEGTSPEISLDFWGFLTRLCYCYCCYYYYKKKQPVNSWQSAAQSELHSATEDELEHKILRERLESEEQPNFDWEKEILRIKAQGVSRASKEGAAAREPSVLQSPDTAQTTSPSALSRLWDLTSRLFELVSPEARKARQDIEWIAAVISAPTASTERCEHSLGPNSPYCPHLTETELERCEHCLRGAFASIVKQSRRKARSSSAERDTVKRSFKSPERHAHRYHHLHRLGQLVVRGSSKSTETLNHSANHFALS